MNTRIVTVLLIALILSACGGDDAGPQVVGLSDNAATDVPTSTSQPATEPAVPSSDAATMVVADTDNDLRLPIAAFGRGRVRALEWSPDGTQLLVTDNQSTTAYNTLNWQPAFMLENARIVGSVTYNRAGTYIAAQTEDRSISIWDSADGALLSTFAWGPHYQQPDEQSYMPPMLNTLQFSPEGDRLLLIVGVQLFEWRLDDSSTEPTVYIADDNRVVAAGYDAFGTIVTAVSDHNLNQASPNFVSARNSDTTVRIHNVINGSRLGTIRDIPGPASSGLFFNSGQKLVMYIVGNFSTRTAAGIYVYDLAAGELTEYNAADGRFASYFGLYASNNGDMFIGQSAEFSPSGNDFNNYLVKLILWDANQSVALGDFATRAASQQPFSIIALDDVSQRVALFGDADSVSIWRLPAGSQEDGDILLQNPEHVIYSFPTQFVELAFLNNDTQVQAVSNNGRYFWDIETGELLPSEMLSTSSGMPPVATIADSGSAAHSADLNAELGVVASVQASVISIRDLGSDDLIEAIMTPYTLSSVRLAPDGNHLLVGSHDGLVSMWNYRTSTEVLTVDTGSGQIINLHQSPNNRVLVVGAGGGTSPEFTFSIWDLTTQENIAAFTLPQNEFVLHTHFSDNGERVAVVAQQFNEAEDTVRNMVNIFNTENLAPIVGLEAPVALNNVRFNVDGTRLVASDFNGRLYVWQLD